MGKIEVQYNVGGLEGLCVITPVRHGDSRGSFMELYNKEDMKAAGFDYVFVQDNQSVSSNGVLRGMHFQKEHAQTKLIRVAKGSIFDVVIDIREGSPTYGKWHGELLTEDNCREFLIPRGFAHGFLVLSETALTIYKCDDFYHPEDEAGIAWDDPQIGIEWPKLDVPYMLSDRDRKWPPIE